MRVLIVTNQVIGLKEGIPVCTGNFYDILNQFAILGDLSVCAEQLGKGSCSNIPNRVIDMFPSEHIHFIKHCSLWCDSYSKSIIDKEVQKCDLVIGYAPSITAEYALWAAHKFGKKYMAYVVACAWDGIWNNSAVGKVVAPYRYLRLRYVLSKSDYALYVTDRFLQNRYPCKGITCGCSDVKIDEPTNDVLCNRIKMIEAMNTNDIINIATCAGVDTIYKGQRFMIEAIYRLKQMGYTNYHYYLLGGGNQTRLRNQAQRLEVASQVHFMGAVPHEEVTRILDTMHIYVLTSLQEGLPRSMVEAMGRGLLCIGFNTGAIPELLDRNYVIDKKDVRGLVNALINVKKASLVEQAKHNIEVAKEYTEIKLNKKRQRLFDEIAHTIES